MGDLRLLEDGSECGGAAGSDVVAPETAKHGRGRGGERPGVSMGADKKANARAAAHLRFVICVSLRMAASAEAPSSPMLLSQRLQRVGEVGRAREQACQRALTQWRTLGLAVNREPALSVLRARSQRLT